MCGIVGILSRHEVAPLILEALRRLEYRGYDSAGIATVHDGRLDRRRAVGKLVALSDLLVTDPIRGRVGIGHTRWATHGAPTVDNAHPHRVGRVAVVHNGIIENYGALRAGLMAEGHRFASETDTEVVAALCDRARDRGLDPEAAVADTVARLEGAFALVFLFEDAPDMLIGVRQGAPLAIAHGAGEMFIGSDALALAPLSTRLTYLEEGDLVVLDHDGARFRDRSGALVERAERVVALENAHADKGAHKHFMAKEIHEQPRVLAEIAARYVAPGRGGVVVPEAPDFGTARRIVAIGCGTAFYAAHVAKYWFEALSRLPVEVEIASEFRYRAPHLGPGTIALFISQSGETADTLAALRHARAEGAGIVSIVNVETSTIARESDLALPILAGPEIGVASTKAFTGQLAVLGLLAVLAGRQTGRIDRTTEARLLAEFETLPGLAAQVAAREPAIAAIARDLAQARDVMFLGRGTLYPLALEGALKLKEISYIHAEGFAAGELKHGPIALVDAAVPVVMLAPSDPLYGKAHGNMQEVMARGARVLLISDRAGQEAAGPGPEWRLTLPEAGPMAAPILYALPLQMLAYHTAVTKGTDVDQPRNLAKSVTVE